MCCFVNVSVCCVSLTVFVNCLMKQFAVCLGVVVILLLCYVLCVMDVFSVLLSSFRLPLCDRWAIFVVIEYQEKHVKVIQFAYI